MAEASALTGTSGTKPESGVAYELRTVPVRTFAAFIPVTRRVISDADQLRNLIDLTLARDLAREIERQVLLGDGTGQNFVGLLNTPGTQVAGPPAGGENAFHVIRRAKTLVAVNARTEASAVVLNPTDSQDIDLLRDTQQRFFSDVFADARRPLWGLDRVESDLMPQGTALVGDFSKCAIFDRGSTDLTVGTVGDDFVRNIVRVLGESRAGFGVFRAKAFVIADLVA